MEHLKHSDPMELVCMCCLCFDNNSRGVGNVLIVTDHYTWYAQGYPCKDRPESNVCIVVGDVIFQVTLTRGQTVSTTWRWQELYIITPYHPVGDVLQERFSCTLLGTLPDGANQHRNMETTCWSYGMYRKLYQARVNWFSSLPTCVWDKSLSLYCLLMEWNIKVTTNMLNKC